MLCGLIFAVDLLAFYGLQSVMQLVKSEGIKILINILFWSFTVGLILSILILKIRIDDINPIRKQAWIASFYGLAVLSFIPKLIFVFIISIGYFAHAVFPQTQLVQSLPWVGLAAGFLPFFVILYGIFKTLYRFKVYHHSWKFKNLPQAFNGIRIVQLSDIHLGSFNYRYHILDRAVLKINHLNPDFIFITGDIINNFSWELKGWEPVFKKLNAKKAKIAVLGNHDYGDYSKWNTIEQKQANFEALKSFYKEVGVNLLLNQSLSITQNNETIALIGIENWGKYPFKNYARLEQALQPVNNIPFKILLSHDPTHWEKEIVKKTDIALMLSGHTHGMQAAFQFRNLKWSPIKYKYKHWAGKYQKGEQLLYVNRGLGWLGFPGRIGVRPEITCIELTADS